MFQIQNLLNIAGGHAIYNAVVNDLFRLGERSRNAFQNRLVINILFQMDAGELQIQNDLGREFCLLITEFRQRLVNVAKFFFQFSCFSVVAKQ